MNLSTDEIQALADQAVRAAGGDWRGATEQFRKQLQASDELKANLLERAMAEELRQAAARLGETTRKCPYCAEIIALDAVKCRFCGEWVDESGSSSRPRPRAAQPSSGPTIRHFTLLTGWVLIVLLILLIISFAR